MSKQDKLSYLAEESAESGGQLKKLKSKLKNCQKEKEEYLSQAQRARADLVNYRRRQELVLEELRKLGQSALLKEVLPVLDSLKLGAKDNQGIKQIKEQLEAVLEKEGLTEIKTIGQRFDPNLHEVVERVKSKEKEGTIVEEIQTGYLLNGQLLRVSKVKIAE